MKRALQLCSLALNPQAPAPTATMVKISDGVMSSFGGTFCIRVPVGVEVGACFSPSTMATFFRKERKAVSYTIHKKKLLLQEGKEKLLVPCLPPEEMPLLDVLSKPVAVEMDMAHMPDLVNVIDPANYRIWGQGVTFRYGMAEATNNAIIVSALSGLPDELEFNLPVDAVKALIRFKSPVVGIASDERSVKFVFKDGCSLTSLVIAEHMVDTSFYYEGEWTPLKIKDAADLLKLDCEQVTFKGGSVEYSMGTIQGIIEDAASKDVAVCVSKVALDTLLKISSDLRVSGDTFRLMAVSDNCRAICSTKSHPT